jgi:hypothetical protein
VISGERFPPDAQIVFDGVPLATTQIAGGRLGAHVNPAQLSSPRTLYVEVRSSAHPGEVFSNALPFIVQPLPEPAFRFVGLIGDLGVFEGIVSPGESFRARRGDVIQGAWRIDSIGSTEAEVTDLRYDARHRLSLFRMN